MRQLQFLRLDCEFYSLWKFKEKVLIIGHSFSDDTTFMYSSSIA